MLDWLIENKDNIIIIIGLLIIGPVLTYGSKIIKGR